MNSLLKMLVVFSVISFSSVGLSQTLRIGLNQYVPHLDFAEENSESKLYQYINKLLLPLGYDLEFIRFPRGRGSIELNKGTIDLLLPYDNKSKNFNTLSLPIFHSMPGLCFKKENFIPILSATHLFGDLLIGVPSDSPVVAPLSNSNALLVELKGVDAISRGIDLTQRGRIDAFYHPSPMKVYHRKNSMYKEVACSYFHGYSTGVFIALSKKMPAEQVAQIELAFYNTMKKMSYEYFFAKSQ